MSGYIWEVATQSWLIFKHWPICCCCVALGSPCDFTWTVQNDTEVLGAASIEDSTEEDTMWQNETFLVSSSPPRMTETSPQGVPVNHKEVEQSHLLVVQDKVKRLNPEEKMSQSTVSQDHVRCDFYWHIKNVTGSETLTVCLNLDESSNDSSYTSWIGYCGCSDAPSPFVKRTHHIQMTLKWLKCHWC